MTQKQSVLSVICNVIKAIDVNLSLVVQAGNEDYFKNIEKDMNAPFLHEVFADRGYNATQMIARSKKGAVLTNANTIVEQYQNFLSEKSFKIDTICFHSDNMASVEGLKLLKNA
jgi:lactam utilization protein B